MDQAAEPTILLVDDSADDCFFTRRALLRLGVDGLVHVAVGAPAALERLSQGGVVLVLLDWHLPGEDGERVLARVRRAAGPGVVVVVLSGRDDDEVRSQALAGGARAVLVKPLDPNDLRPLLPAALAGYVPA